MTLKPGTRIQEMFAFVCVDETDVEGVTAMTIPSLGGLSPLIGADMERVDSLRKAAKLLAGITKQRIELVKFTNREHMEWIDGE